MQIVTMKNYSRIKKYGKKIFCHTMKLLPVISLGIVSFFSTVPVMAASNSPYAFSFNMNYKRIIIILCILIVGGVIAFFMGKNKNND